MTPRERLDKIHAITSRGGDVSDPEAHGEDCPSGYCDGEDYRIWRHAGCDIDGQQIGNVGDPSPDVECCDPDDEIDETAIAEACECGLTEWAEIHRLSAPEQGEQHAPAAPEEKPALGHRYHPCAVHDGRCGVCVDGSPICGQYEAAHAPEPPALITDHAFAPVHSLVDSCQRVVSHRSPAVSYACSQPRAAHAPAQADREGR